MIELYSFGPKFGLPDPSPFVLKIDAFLRLSGIDFESKADFNNLQKAPKNKLPFIKSDGRIIADSYFIIEHLKQIQPTELDAHLSEEQLAQAYCIGKMLEESFYWCGVYFRWQHEPTWKLVKQDFFGDLPFPLKYIIPLIARKNVISAIKKQGLGRHNESEILSIAKHSLDSIETLLKDKPHIFGDKISSLDATIYAFLAQAILAQLDTPLSKLARSYTTLNEYCDRIHSKLYATA